MSSPSWGRCCAGWGTAWQWSTAITCIGAHSTLQCHRELLWSADPSWIPIILHEALQRRSPLPPHHAQTLWLTGLRIPIWMSLWEMGPSQGVSLFLALSPIKIVFPTKIFLSGISENTCLQANTAAVWILFPAHFNEVLISEADRDYVSANTAKQNCGRNKNKWKSTKVNPITTSASCRSRNGTWRQKNIFAFIVPQKWRSCLSAFRPAPFHLYPTARPGDRATEPHTATSSAPLFPDSCRRMAPGSSREASKREARGGSVH